MFAHHTKLITHISCSSSGFFDKLTHHMNWVRIAMLRFRLKELIAEKEFRENRVVTLVEIANATGIHRMTLSKLANHRGYNPSADILDRLCSYFGCRIEQLVEHITDS